MLQLLFNIDFFSIYVNINSQPSIFFLRKGAKGFIGLIRTFLAIELPSSILKRLKEVQQELKTCQADVRWVDPNSIHLTLKFLGNIEEKQMESIVKAVEKSVQRTPFFSLKVQGVGGFPDVRNPRVLWIGLEERGALLSTLQNQLEKELEKIGFKSENRPFHPHLTLGRVKSTRGKACLVEKMGKYKEECFGEFEVERVILFKSELRPAGPIYTPLKEIRLGGSREKGNGV